MKRGVASKNKTSNTTTPSFIHPLFASYTVVWDLRPSVRHSIQVIELMIALEYPLTRWFWLSVIDKN